MPDSILRLGPFDTGYLSAHPTVFGFRPEARLATWADLFECVLFYKHVVIVERPLRFHQASQNGLKTVLRWTEENRHEAGYVDLIESLIHDILTADSSSVLRPPGLWGLSTDGDGSSATIRISLKDRHGTSGRYYREERYQQTPGIEETYYSSAYYREHGTGIHHQGAHPTGVCYHTKTNEVSFLYGFSEVASQLLQAFASVALPLLEDAPFLERWIRNVIAMHAPELIDDVAALEVGTERIDDYTVRVSTNVNVSKMVRYHLDVAPERFPDAQFDPSGDWDDAAANEDILRWLLSPLLSELECLLQTCLLEGSSHHHTGPLSGLQLLRATESPPPASRSQQEIHQFVDVVIGHTGSVREKIIRGEAQPMELLKLYERSDKWRQWTSQLGGDSNLVREYIKTIHNDPWIARLPSKTLRFLVTTGIGIGLDIQGAGGLGTAAGVAIGALDAFLLERLAVGYTPREFVNRLERL